MLLILFLVFNSGAFSQEAGKIVALHGQVRAGNRPLSTTSPIYSGDVVQTGTQSGAKLLMADQSVLDVGPSSRVKIAQYPAESASNTTAEVGLETGSIRALISKKAGQSKGKFNFRTKWGMMQVTGTEFVLHDIGFFSLLVIEGSVALIIPGPDGRLTTTSVSGGSQVLFTDYESVLRGLGAPRVEKVSPKEAVLAVDILPAEAAEDFFEQTVSDEKDADWDLTEEESRPSKGDQTRKSSEPSKEPSHSAQPLRPEPDSRREQEKTGREVERDFPKLQSQNGQPEDRAENSPQKNPPLAPDSRGYESSAFAQSADRSNAPGGESREMEHLNLSRPEGNQVNERSRPPQTQEGRPEILTRSPTSTESSEKVKNTLQRIEGLRTRIGKGETLSLDELRSTLASIQDPTAAPSLGGWEVSISSKWRELGEIGAGGGGSPPISLSTGMLTVVFTP